MSASALFHVCIAETQPLILSGLKALLEEIGESAVVGEALTVADARACLTNAPEVQVLLLDDTLQGEEQAELRQLKHDFPKLAVLTLSFSGELTHILAAVRAGADGYLLKNTSAEELTLAVRNVVRGQAYYASYVAEILLRHYFLDHPVKKSPAGSATLQNPLVQLTPREQEILTLVSDEHTTNNIADMLGLSRRTVENHRYRLMQKLGVKSAGGLVRYALESGLI